MPPRLRSVLCCALVATFARVAGAQMPAHETSDPARVADIEGIPINAAALDQGRRLFETHCAPCHGPRGEGAKGPTLVQPSLPRASDDASLLRIIRNGIDGTEMPRTRLNGDELPLVAAFVKSLGAMPS